MKIKILTIALLAFATTAVAQDNATKPTKDAAVMEKRAQDATTADSDKQSLQMAKELGLDEKQTETLKQLDRQYNHEMTTLLASKLEKEQLQQRATELNQQRDTRLRYLLTPEQFEKMQVLREQKRAESRQKEAEMNKATGK
jgi:Spy/CpxP family protein refolding chaperone